MVATPAPVAVTSPLKALSWTHLVPLYRHVATGQTGKPLIACLEYCSEVGSYGTGNVAAHGGAARASRTSYPKQGATRRRR